MTVEMNWHEGEEQSGIVWDSSIEPLPMTRSAPGRIGQSPASSPDTSHWRLLLLGAGIGVILGLLALGAMVLWRAHQGSQLARQDLAAATAWLLEAQAAGDVQRYAELLDSTDQVWKARLIAGLRHPARRAPLALEVQKVRLLGDLAEAEVVQGDGDDVLHRLLYYRLVDGQWRLAPPAPAAFGEEKQTSTTHFRIHYRQRDERFLPALINLAEGTYVALCGELRCASDGQPLELRLLYDARAEDSSLTPGVALVASPSLAGWDASGKPGAQFNQQLAGQIAMHIAASKAPHASTSLLEVIGAWAMEEPVNGRTSMDDVLSGMDPIQRLMSLDRAWAAIARRNSNDWLARVEIGSVLRFVQSAWGSDAVGLLLENASGSFDETTRRTFQLDSATFQQIWLAWLARQLIPEPGISTG